MRPLELDLTAFRSYDRQTIDLRPHELVVITGDTGAGKTSLLDAIAFAIFGRTPEQGTPKDLLTLGREHGEVRLTFAARGEVWRVARRYGPAAPEPRLLLERLADDGGAAVETIAGADAVGARLETVVGMGFRAFTSAVLLAQGRFAEFLTAKPGDRDAILRELFGVASLEGARAAAQAAEAAAKAEADLREGDAARLPPHDPGARVAAARAARAAAADLAEAVRLRPVAERLARHTEEAARAGRRREVAEEVAGTLPDPGRAADLTARLAAARRAVEEADAARAGRARAHVRALAARDAARERHGGAAADLAGLRERAARAERLAVELPAREEALARRAEALTADEGRAAALAQAVAEAAAAAAWLDRREAARAAEAAMRAQEGALTDRAARLGVAEAALAEARAARERAQLHDLAAAIRAGLSPGEPCPVCGAAVAEHPAGPPELAGAEAALADAQQAAEAAMSAHAAAAERARTAGAAQEAASAEAARAAAALGREVAEEEAAERRAALPALRAEAEALAARVRADAAGVGAERRALAEAARERDADRAGLGAWAAVDDPAAALEGAVAEARALEEATGAAAAALSDASEAAAAARGGLAALEGGPIAALRAAVARAAERGRLEAPGDEATPEELIAAAERLRDTALGRAREHAEHATAAAARAGEARAELAAAGGGLAVESQDQVEPAVRRLREARDAARAAGTRLEELAATARRLTADAASARARAEVHHQVTLDLRANAFPRFLLARYRERLAVGASAHLQVLSAGAFRFRGSGTDPMAVVDARRGERPRPASTLSGGERFLASLALALGLGDVAAESSGRLDCLFLDEGFSTLDAESLEQALAGVERLAGDGRLVGVITHLPGVAERLGATIHVVKDPEGVSRVRPL